MAEEIQLHPDLQALVDDQFAFAGRLQALGSFAPLAASMNPAGEITGAALVTSEVAIDLSNLSADEGVGLLTRQFIDAAQRGEIKASAIFFHGHNDGGPAPRPAATEAEANCLVVFLDHRDGPAVAAVFNYRQATDGRWVYAPPFFIRKKAIVFAPRP